MSRITHFVAAAKQVTTIQKHPTGARTITRTIGGEEMASMSLEPTHKDGVPREAGYATAHPESLAVEGVEVHPEHAGQGHATDLWRTMEKLHPHLSHSVDRTYEGDTWAKKVGGHLPPLPISESSGYPLYAEHYGEWNQ